MEMRHMSSDGLRVYQLPQKQYGFCYEVGKRVGFNAKASAEAYFTGKNTTLAEVSQPEYALMKMIAVRRGITLPAYQ